MKPFLAAACLTLILAGSAAAAPVLKSDVVVSTPIVTVGDMFEGADLYAERPLFRSPAPGTTGEVSLDAVRVAAALVGLTDYDPPHTGSVTVARFGASVDTQMLAGLIQTALGDRGFLGNGVEALVRFDSAPPLLTADTASDPVALTSLSYSAGAGQFTARFAVSGRKAPVELSGRADLMIAVPHLADNLAGNAIIRPEDVEMRQVPVRQADTGSFSSLDQIVGLQLKRPARAGKMLQPGDVKPPALVSRNEQVTIIYRSGPLTLTVKGQAMSDAAEGETVQVLNLMSSRVLSATAIAAGTVSIAGPAIVIQ